MLDRLFQISGRDSTINREATAGLTTFAAMAYIIFVNPAILSSAGVPFDAAVMATCVAAGLVTILMGAFTNYPLAMASGMGLNAMVAFSLVAGMGLSWQTAMGVVVIEGLIVLALSLTTIREAIMNAVPEDLKLAIGVGLGLFIAFIGLKEAMIVVDHPVTLVSLGSLRSGVPLLSLVGLLITILFMARRTPGALLIGMIMTAMIGCAPGVRLIPGAPSLLWALLLIGLIIGAILGRLNVKMAPVWAAIAVLILSLVPPFSIAGQIITNPFAKQSVAANFSTFFQADIMGALKFSLIPVIFAFFMSDFFDTMGTAIGIGRQAGFVDEHGRIPRIRPLLIVDSLGAVIGGLFGCSSVTAYVESAAGASVGGRTGLASIVTGLAFLLSPFFLPLIGIIGGGIEVAPGVYAHPVTAPALILVGFLMIEHVGKIDFEHIENGFPSFLVIIGIPMTYSISHGIAFGFISYCAIQLVRGRARQVHPFLYIVALLFILALGAW